MHNRAFRGSFTGIDGAAGVRLIHRIPAVYVALGISSLVLIYRLGLFADQGAPPGSDVGNWLALGRELLGDHVKAATVPYPPVIPGLTGVLALVLPPLTALTILGAVVSVSVGLPFFLLVRRDAGLPWAAVFTIGFLFLGYTGEMLAWGGYPQLLSHFFLLSGLYLLGRGLVDNRRDLLLLAGVAAGLSMGTSSLTIMFLTITIPLFVVFLAARHKTNFRGFSLGVVAWAIVAGVVSLVFLPVYLDTWQLRDGQAWNPHGFTLATSPSAIAYVFKEWPDAIASMRTALLGPPTA